MRPINSSADRLAGTAVRFCIAGAALLFVLSAILSSLPDAPTLQERLENSALTGYGQVSVTTPGRQPILEEYYDHLPQTEPSPITAQAPRTQ